MKTTEPQRVPRKALVILTFQIIAWLVILSNFFSDFSSGTDAAGAGLARGFALLLVDVPCMFFIFITTFYFFIKTLPTWFRYIATFNYVGLFTLVISINW